MQHGRSRIGISVFLFPFSFFLLLSVGCSHSSTLVVRCENKNKAFTQNFPQAVANCTEDGTYEFVLISDDTRPEQSRKIPLVQRDKSGRPLNPTESMPLHQVVHVKVLWRPLDGTDRAVGSNASLVWYVLTDTAQGEGDLLEYRGSAFVMVDPKEDVTKVTIEDGTIKPGAVRGQLCDPLGQAHIEGKFIAVNDGERLRAILNSTQQRARTAAAAMAQ